MGDEKGNENPVEETTLTVCAGMEPTCTTEGVEFTASANGEPAEPGNYYGCLTSQPDPTWYYFKISQTGSLSMVLSAPEDIDFIIYGPFDDLSAAQAQCGTMPQSKVVDCGYSDTASETPSVQNVQIGEIYVMMVTNYAQKEQAVTLMTTANSIASTDCSILKTKTLSCPTLTQQECPWRDSGTQFDALRFSADCISTITAFGETGTEQIIKTFELSKVSLTATVPSHLRLYLSVKHPRAGDLSAKLEHEGKWIYLFTDSPYGAAQRCDKPDIDITINPDAENAPTIDGAECSDLDNRGIGYSGVHKAHGGYNGLKDFVGTKISGEWKLTITDHTLGQGEGQLVNFYILFEDDDIANCPSTDIAESCHTTRTRYWCPFYDRDYYDAKWDALELECDTKHDDPVFGETGTRRIVRTFEADPARVDTSATVTSLIRATLRIWHPRAGDLSAKLEHEGKTVYLFTAQHVTNAVRCNNPRIDIKINDDAVNAATIDGSQCDTDNYGYSGVHKAHGNGLKEFIGTKISGEWKLTITDHILGEGEGGLTQFTLFFEDNHGGCVDGDGWIQDANPLVDIHRIYNGDGGYSISEMVAVSFITSMAVIFCVALIAFISYRIGYRKRNKYDVDGYAKAEMSELTEIN